VAIAGPNRMVWSGLYLRNGTDYGEGFAPQEIVVCWRGTAGTARAGDLQGPWF